MKKKKIIIVVVLVVVMAVVYYYLFGTGLPTDTAGGGTGKKKGPTADPNAAGQENWKIGDKVTTPLGTGTVVAPPTKTDGVLTSAAVVLMDGSGTRVDRDGKTISTKTRGTGSTTSTIVTSPATSPETPLVKDSGATKKRDF